MLCTQSSMILVLVTLTTLAITVPVTVTVAENRQQQIVVQMHRLTPTGVGEFLGTIVIAEKEGGITLRTKLRNLGAPGLRGFHVHVFPSCAPQNNAGQIVAGGGAGTHYDPHSTKMHAGPHGSGHLGDLLNLVVDKYGRANDEVYAPKLTINDVQKRSLVIHALPDDFNGNPGGARFACGLVPQI